MSPLVLVATMIAAAVAQAPPPVAPPSEPILANATVEVSRLHLAPGSTESIRTGTTPMLVIQLTAGDVNLTQGGKSGEKPCRC